MRRPVRMAGISLIAASALLLSGCAKAPEPVPPGPTASQVNGFIQQWVDWQIAHGTDGEGHAVTHWQVRFREFVPDALRDAVVASCADSTVSDEITRVGAHVICGYEYPSATMRAEIRTDQQLDYLYDYFTNVMLPCLRDNGVEIHNMPPEDIFRNSAHRELHVWNPYEVYRNRLTRTPTDLETLDGTLPFVVVQNGTAPMEPWLRSKCPPTPPGW